MRKNYAIFSGALMVAASAMTLSAQQLPNAGFEEEWSNNVPWTAAGNTKECTQTIDDVLVTAQNPSPWTISHVIGMGGTGATIVGEKAEGYESATAVNVHNSPNPYMASQIVPGYVTLGTTWSTAKVTIFGGVKPTNADGGTFGGIDFTYRPDAVSFMYTRSHGTAMPDEQATVVAYLWKGTYTQEKVPGEIKLLANPTTCTMTDRDRNILGYNTPQGGTVKSTDGAACVAKIDYAIEGNATEWTNKVIEFEYLTNDTPEKFNIIFAAGNYWETTPGNGNSLTVDDVKLLYYSRLKEVKVNGVAVPSFDPDVFDYTMTAEMPADASAIEATHLGNAKGADISVALDQDNKKATITVSHSAGNDVDDKAQHIYTINFTAGDDPADVATYTGKLVIEMGGGQINEGDETQYKVYITPTGENTCNFSLPDFKLALGGEDEEPVNLGTIEIPNCTMTRNSESSMARAAGWTITYTGHKDNLSLLDGGIIADVDLNGTEQASGDINMKINVGWKQDDGTTMPIDVSFAGKKDVPAGVAAVDTDNADAPVEYYNLQGIRVENPANGVYIRRQGSKVSKVLVK